MTPLESFEKKLDVVRAMASSVIEGRHTGFLLTGPRGVSKTWTIEQEVLIGTYKRTAGKDYYKHTGGRLSAIGLLDSLEEFAGTEEEPKTLLYDDVPMDNKECWPILMAAMGRQGGPQCKLRIVKHRVNKVNRVIRLYSGIIAIRNAKLVAVDRQAAALGSRMLVGDLIATSDELKAKAFDIISEDEDRLPVRPEDAAELATHYFERCEEWGIGPDLRLLFDQLMPFREKSFGIHWRDLVDILLKQQIEPPRHVVGRDEMVQQNKAILLRITQECPVVQDQIAKWEKATGLRLSAFYKYRNLLKADGATGESWNRGIVESRNRAL